MLLTIAMMEIVIGLVEGELMYAFIIDKFSLASICSASFFMRGFMETLTPVYVTATPCCVMKFTDFQQINRLR